MWQVLYLTLKYKTHIKLTIGMILLTVVQRWNKWCSCFCFDIVSMMIIYIVRVVPFIKSVKWMLLTNKMIYKYLVSYFYRVSTWPCHFLLCRISQRLNLIRYCWYNSFSSQTWAISYITETFGFKKSCIP